MEANPYVQCPCGSGKTFKFCCQPIHKQVARVFELDEEGQHEAAFNLMAEVVKQHPQNPEAYGRQAQLEKVPYMLVVGEKEQSAGAVAVRSRAQSDLGAMPVDEFVRLLDREVRERRLPPA